MKAYSSDSSAANDDLQPFLRTGKVSMRKSARACSWPARAMRMRSRLSDEVTKCEGACEAQKRLEKTGKESMEGGLWYARSNL